LAQAQYPQDWPYRMASDHKSSGSEASTPLSAWGHDDRIKAAVIAAPSLGPPLLRPVLRMFMSRSNCGAAQTTPILRAPYFAQTIYDALPTKPEYHVVPKAGHFSFIAPCPSELARVAPEVCKDESGFDRTRFHEEFDRAVVSFSGRTLPSIRKPATLGADAEHHHLTVDHELPAPGPSAQGG
jgi:hypothetical protein